MNRIGLVCRFKPLHLGHAAVLRAVCRLGDEVTIGVGSANRYDRKNPFSFDETAEQLAAYLGPRFQNWRVIPIEDLGHGPRWRALVEERFGPLELFVSANDYVRELLAPVYPLAHPLELIPAEDRVPVDGTGVRRAMARGEAWERLVPPETQAYLVERGLPERFRREFGLETLALEQAPGTREEVTRVLLG
ncbi:MAG: adenylyltransferase/cytidyltransferase family protein [Planctomycetota bacterium]